MKIYEILDPIHNKQDSFDILKNKDIVELDAQYDTVSDISNDFIIPIEWINYELAEELKNIAKTLYPSIIQSFPDENNDWNIKMNKLIKYFNI